ncbi:MAG TPA: DUF1501 domain-containing protein [Candidatus Saccharimonadales bacterium]|nr:DUF1501 domain-containing protein [Candidatus Saccharimonadales bacterium]
MRSPPFNLGAESRRQFLWRFGGGLGGIAMADLLARQGLLAGPAETTSRAALPGGLHHPARVKRVVQLFMNGGASQMDAFDYKPELAKRNGQKFEVPGEHVEAATSVPGNVLQSPFTFRQHGQCGRWVSSAFPHLAGCVDDIAFLMAMASKTNVHGPASYMMNTGFLLPGFPCAGAWVSYALGSLNENLPTFVVLPDAKGLPYNQKGNFSSGFLPMTHQGTILRPTAASPINDLFAPASARSITPKSEQEGLDLLNRMNRRQLAQSPGDTRLEARIASYELAAKLQLSAPEALDLSGESYATRQAYGLEDPVTEDFGRRCLLARCLLERGVRFVQVWSGQGGPTGNWDNHANIEKELPPMAAATDKPTAALLQDLKERGLFEDTLLVWSTEFGRMPFSQGGTGRDHNGGTFVSWLAGAGVRGGIAHGASDEWSWKAAEGRTYCYDLHATMLHLLGIDHEKLTFRHNGTNRRLTDVHGEVVHGILS